MSQIIKPVALDETLQTTNSKLTGIDTKITNAGTSLDNVKTAVDGMKTTLDTDIKATNTAIDGMKTTLDTDIKATNTAIEAMANALVGAWASVKSVNGKNGDVVLDGNDLKINKAQQNSKTVTDMMTEMQNAIARTPLTFGASQIEGDDYLLTITQGTPA